MSKEPAIELGMEGFAPVLSYSVPEGTTYSGRNFIDLQFPESYFKKSAEDRASQSSASSAAPLVSKAEIQQLGIDPVEVEQMERAGKRLNVYRTLYGNLAHTYLNADPASGMSLASTTSALAATPTLLAPREDLGSEGPGPIASMLPRDQDLPDDREPTPLPVRVAMSISSPAAGATVNGPHGGAVFTVTGTVAVTQGGGSISGVEVRIGDGAYRAAALSGGTWTLADANAGTMGELLITARATHSSGLVTSRQIKIIIQLEPRPDVTPPSIRILSPSPGQMLAGNGRNVSLKVEGTAGDDRVVARVELAVDSDVFMSTDSGDGWRTWFKTISLAPGTHTIKARAIDGAGNESNDSLTVQVDSEAPSVTIVEPAGRHEVFGTELSGATVEVVGTANDANGIARVELSLGGTPVTILATPNGPDDWSQWKGSLLLKESGLHIIKARAVDRAGNISETEVGVLVTIAPESVSRLKRLIIVEQYQLSSYLGNYGAGRTLKTFSLLPGEKTKISIRTYSQDETTSKSASSILDSFTETSASDFQSTMENEQSDHTAYKESFDYKVGLQAKASWGFGSASVTGEVSGGTNGAREEFAKNIANAVKKHAASASSKRDVQINTSYETKSTKSEENSIVRDIQNINVSRTLNFVFRQMNQEFITLLHLTDVRIGFFEVKTVVEDGVQKEKPVYREATLPQLDALLTEVIAKEHRDLVRRSILNQLMHIFDHQDRHHAFVEDVVMKDEHGNDVPYSNYLRVKKDYRSIYQDVSGNTIPVNGIIIAANKHVLRTEGVVVEAILGQGNALDDYSENLQKEAIREKKLGNELLLKQIRREALAQQIVTEGRSDQAQLFARVFPTSATEETAKTPAAEPARV